MHASIERRENVKHIASSAHFLNQAMPVILPGLCSHWPAMTRWSLDFFRREHGDRTIKVDERSMTFAAFIDQLQHSTPQSPSSYLRELYLAREIPALLQDLPGIPFDYRNRLNARLLPYPDLRRRGNPELLVAGLGAHFPVLHYDLDHMHAFITQIQGEKRFWLYPPDQARYLYAREDMRNISAIPSFDPVDTERYPLFEQASGMETVVRPGETIFVPSGWWHRTQILSTSIAVTWNAVSRQNWPDFIEDHYLAWTRRRRTRTLLKQIYFAGLGAGLTIYEICTTEP